MQIIEGFIVVYFIVLLNLFFNKLKDFSCNVQRIWNNYVSIRHILNFITMFFLLVIFTRNNPVAPYILIIASFILYIFFILVTRCEFNFLVAFIICMVITFYLEAYKVYKLSLKSISQEEKDTMKINIEKIEINVQIIAIIIVLIGVLVYIGQHVREFGKDWNWTLFWLGTQKCAGDGVPESTSMLSDISLAFKQILSSKPVFKNKTNLKI